MGKRYLGYESITNAQVERDDHGFQSYNAQQAFYVGIFPQVRLIARGGYDNVMEPGIVNISAPMWSGGALNIPSTSCRGFRSSPASATTIPPGPPIYICSFSMHLYASGRYFEAIQPNQLQINSSFVNFIAPTAQLPVELTNNNTFGVNGVTGNIDDQTALTKQGNLDLVYNWLGNSISLQVAYDDRLLLTSNTHDRSLVSGIGYERNIAPDLNFSASADYYRTFANPFFGASDAIGGNIGLQYDINSTMRGVAGYAYQHQTQLVANGPTVTENVLFAAVAKRF